MTTKQHTASDVTESSSVGSDPPGSSRMETTDSCLQHTPTVPGDDSGESPAGINGSSSSTPIIKSSPSVTRSSKLVEHSYLATAAENDGGPEPEDTEGQHHFCDERSVDRARPKISNDDVDNQSGSSLKFTVVTTTSETHSSEPGTLHQASSEESPAGADEFFFFQSNASDAIKIVSGDAANLNTSKKELEVVVSDEDDHLPSWNSKTGSSNLPRFESLEGVAACFESLEGVAASMTGLQRCLDRGQRSIFDRYDDEDVATNPKELLNVSGEDGFFETMKAGCDAITSWATNLNDSGEDGGPRGTLGRISASSLADEMDKLIDVVDVVVDDAISGKVCSMDCYECEKGGLDDEYHSDASFNDESERTQAAPTVQQLSAIKRMNVSLQSQLSATARQLSSLKGRNDDLLSEVMQLQRQLETTKRLVPRKVSSLQRELEAERRGAERAEARAAAALEAERTRAAAALEAERSRADAAKEDAAFALEVAKNAWTALHKSGWRMKLNGKRWERSELPPPNGGEGTDNAEGGKGVPSEPVVEGMEALDTMVKDYVVGMEDVVGRLREKISWRRR